MSDKSKKDPEVKIGDLLKCTIDSDKTILKRVKGCYNYNDTRRRARCPICGGVGIPWNGMFHCEDQASHKAIISTGQCFEVIDNG